MAGRGQKRACSRGTPSAARSAGARPDPDLPLLEAYRRGDEDAEFKLAVRVDDLIHLQAPEAAYKLGMQFSAEDVDDLSQEILHSLFENDGARIRGFEGRSSFANWVAVIVRHRLIDFARSVEYRERMQTSSLLDDEEDRVPGGVRESALPGDAASPEEQLVCRELSDGIQEAMERALNERERLFLGWKIMEGYSVKEIAEMTGATENAVRVTLFRARQKLRQYLKV